MSARNDLLGSRQTDDRSAPAARSIPQSPSFLPALIFFLSVRTCPQKRVKPKASITDYPDHPNYSDCSENLLGSSCVAFFGAAWVVEIGLADIVAGERVRNPLEIAEGAEGRRGRQQMKVLQLVSSAILRVLCV
jgi:hypothetical protein